MSRLIEHLIRRIVPAPSALTHSIQRLLAVGVCLCVFCVGPLCGPPLRWWVLCGALPSVWVPCVGPLCGSPVWVPCVGPLCVGPLCGSTVWVPRHAASCCIYSRDASRSFTRSHLQVETKMVMVNNTIISILLREIFCFCPRSAASAPMMETAFLVLVCSRVSVSAPTTKSRKNTIII